MKENQRCIPLATTDKDMEGSKDSSSDEEEAPTFRRFAAKSSMHGLNNATNESKNVGRRSTWVIAMLLCVTVLLFVLITQIIVFLQYEVQTTLSFEDKDSLLFPSVTICNHNQFRKSKVMEDPELAEALRVLFPVAVHHVKPRTVTQSVLDVITAIPEDINITSTLTSLAHTLEDMIPACTWKRKEIPCASYFSEVLTEVGLCYTFNSKVIQESLHSFVANGAGSDHSLVLLINVQNDEYYYGESSSSGIKVLLHSPEAVPHMRQHGFSVAPGTTTYTAIRQTEYRYAKAPYGNCVDIQGKSEDYLEFYDTYTTTACQSEYRTKAIFGVCKCKMFHDPGMLPVCKTVEAVKCYKDVEDNITAFGILDIKRKCPPMCNQIKYNTQLSHANFPGQQIIEDLQSALDVSEEKIRKNYLALWIYFEDLGVHMVEQSAKYSGAALFSDIGGQMGLCIGASILTIVELLEFCFVVLFAKLCKDKQRFRS